MPRLFADRIRPIHCCFTKQHCVSGLQRYTAALVYLQHGGDNDYSDRITSLSPHICSSRDGCRCIGLKTTTSERCKSDDQKNTYMKCSNVLRAYLQPPFDNNVFRSGLSLGMKWRADTV